MKAKLTSSLFTLMAMLLVLGLNSCKNRNGSAETSLPSDTAMETPEEMMQDEGHDESLGNKTMTGKLVTNKGATPQIDGVFISKDYFKQDGQDWYKVMEPFIGKKVEAKGEVIRHWCGPMEQCLSQGYMDWMRKPEYVKILN